MYGLHDEGQRNENNLDGKYRSGQIRIFQY